MLPVLLFLAQITTAPYSPEARAARLEGTANAWAEIDRDGKVLDAGLLQGLGMGLDTQAVEAVRNRQFKPDAPGFAAIDVVYSLPDGPHWRIARMVHRFNVAHRQSDPKTRRIPVLANPVLREYTRPDDASCAAGTAVSVHFLLDSSGVPTGGDMPEPVRAWRFDPARRNGVPVPVTTEVLLKCGTPPEEQPTIHSGPLAGPRLLHSVEPMYSEQARAAKLQGTVLVEGVVNPYGFVDSMRVRRTLGLGLGLDVQALEAVRQWTFAPATKGGRPVHFAPTIEVNFRLL